MDKGANYDLKTISKKKSVKQFKIQKKIKGKNHPNFMLDNISIERLTTEPDYHNIYNSQKSIDDNRNAIEPRKFVRLKTKSDF